MKTATHAPLRVEILERQFDRIQFLFTRVDAKVNAVLAISSGQIAVASVGISGGDWKSLAVLIPAALFLVCTAFTMVNLYRCTFPEVKRSGESLVYFAQIASFSRDSYVESVLNCSEDQWKKDIATQTWKTADIARRKFKYLKHATAAAMISLAPWTWLMTASSWRS